MNEILDALLDKFRKPFWRAFTLAWLTWNWQVWYVTLFVDSNIAWDKIIYISKMYCYIEKYKDNFEFFWINFYNKIFPEIWFIVHWFLIPLFLSYLIVWYFPFVTNKYLDKNQQTKKDELKILNKYAENIKKENKTLWKIKEWLTQKKKLEKSIEVSQTQKEMSKEEESQKEIDDFKSKYTDGLRLLNDFIYKKEWHINNDDWHRQIDTSIESLFHTHWLIEEHGSSHGWKSYKITEKWKLFLKSL